MRVWRGRGGTIGPTVPLRPIAEVAAEIVEQVLAGLPPLGHVARVAAADTILSGAQPSTPFYSRQHEVTRKLA